MFVYGNDEPCQIFCLVCFSLCFAVPDSGGSKCREGGTISDCGNDRNHHNWRGGDGISEGKEGGGMKFILLTGVEWKKLRRSRILLIMGMAAVMLWIPSIINAHLNFEMQAEGISPEHNFLIQGFMGMAWFMFPAGMVVSTVLLAQTERSNHGILRMLVLPVSTAKLCMAKFVILLILAAIQMMMMTGMYFLSAAVASRTQG